jgi:hypothetical protein
MGSSHTADPAPVCPVVEEGEAVRRRPLSMVTCVCTIAWTGERYVGEYK